MILKTSLVTIMLLAMCFGQQTHVQQSASGSASDKQVRLEDIERDTVPNSQQRSQTSQTQHQQTQQQQQHQHQHQQQQQQQQQQYGLTQQQLAAYQQQLLLQQLQQQYFAPQPITYPSYNALPLMIIPGNHLGVGSPALPLQAYFLPDPIIYQQPSAAALQTSQQAVSSPANSLYQVPAQQLQPTARYQSQLLSNQGYRVPQQTQQPIHNFVYTSTPPQSSQPQGQQFLYQQQQQLQQPYNAYNAIYQQRQQKNLYSSGVKSTPAPPGLLKSASQSSPLAYSQAFQNNDQTASSYINYKSF